MAPFAFSNSQVRKAETIAAKLKNFFITLRQRCAASLLKRKPAVLVLLCIMQVFRSLKKLRESPRWSLGCLLVSMEYSCFSLLPATHCHRYGLLPLCFDLPSTCGDCCKVRKYFAFVFAFIRIQNYSEAWKWIAKMLNQQLNLSK